MSKYNHFSVEHLNDVAMVRLSDPKLFETLLVSELEDDLMAYIDQQHPKNMLISFQGVTHCSTAVINGLLRAKKRLIAADGQLKLCGMRDTIREAYRMLNLDGTVFDIHDDCAQALKAF